MTHPGKAENREIEELDATRPRDEEVFSLMGVAELFRETRTKLNECIRQINEMQKQIGDAERTARIERVVFSQIGRLEKHTHDGLGRASIPIAEIQ